MSWLHHRAAWATYFGLAFLAVAFDFATRFFGIPLLPLNWLVVWLFVQQLGFGVRDGWYAKRPAWLLALLTLVAYGLLVVAVFGLGYSNDMLDNLNPPTATIVLLALAQCYLFTLLQPAIRKLMTIRPVLLVVGALGMFGMVIYLWHTVAMALVLWGQLALGLPFPEPLSGAWWWTRIPWVLAIGAVIAACCVLVPKLERLWAVERDRRTRAWAAWLWSIVAVVGVGWTLVVGYLPIWQGLLGFTLVVIAIVALTIGGPGRGREPRTRVREHAGDVPVDR